jgi:hypothetical protein
MNPLSIRVKLRIPSNPPSYRFVQIGSSSLAALEEQVRYLISPYLPSGDVQWHLQVNRDENGSPKTYIVTTSKDVMRVMTQDILFPCFELPPSTVTHLHEAPLKVRSFPSSA